ncbi:hypothetical protein ACFSNO_31465 [Streptomyces cirratus]
MASHPEPQRVTEALDAAHSLVRLSVGPAPRS